QKRHLNMALLKDSIRLLCDELKLPDKQRDHCLTGNWAGHRECHLQPDWLLLYQINNGLIIFERTGSHSDLFG
ncbi:MAG: type II toxin-antitoxin system YafQ family toxin, partial [Eubacterium sp.]